DKLDGSISTCRDHPIRPKVPDGLSNLLLVVITACHHKLHVNSTLGKLFLQAVDRFCMIFAAGNRIHYKQYFHCSLCDHFAIQKNQCHKCHLHISVDRNRHSRCGRVINFLFYASTMDTNLKKLLFTALVCLPVFGFAQTLKPYEQKIPGTNVSFRMVPIKGGTFTMGSPANEKGRQDDEGPQKKVQVSSFWMGEREVTF